MGRILLVTGGAGFLGRHLLPLAGAGGWVVHAPSSAEMDVTHQGRVDAAVAEVRPDAVVHLAYRMHDTPGIVDGAGNVARAARAAGARLVHLSTDLVFPGRDTPYSEEDPPAPLHEYGRAKARAEEVVMTEHPGAVMIRTSILYGTAHRAPAQEAVARALEDPASFTFFHDEVRSFTHAGDVAAAVLELVRRREVRGPLHVAGPEPLDRAEFARRCARWMGGDASVLGSGSGAGGTRPGRVVLDSRRAEALGIRCRKVGEGLAGAGAG
ncbi:MAG: sugar nucleotide-binding protein [Thermoleophilia bacterium]